MNDNRIYELLNNLGYAKLFSFVNNENDNPYSPQKYLYTTDFGDFKIDIIKEDSLQNDENNFNIIFKRKSDNEEHFSISFSYEYNLYNDDDEDFIKKHSIFLKNKVRIDNSEYINNLLNECKFDSFLSQNLSYAQEEISNLKAIENTKRQHEEIEKEKALNSLLLNLIEIPINDSIDLNNLHSKINTIVISRNSPLEYIDNAEEDLYNHRIQKTNYKTKFKDFDILIEHTDDYGSTEEYTHITFENKNIKFTFVFGKTMETSFTEEHAYHGLRIGKHYINNDEAIKSVAIKCELEQLLNKIYSPIATQEQTDLSDELKINNTKKSENNESKSNQDKGVIASMISKLRIAFLSNDKKDKNNKLGQ